MWSGPYYIYIRRSWKYCEINAFTCESFQLNNTLSELVNNSTIIIIDLFCVVCLFVDSISGLSVCGESVNPVIHLQLIQPSSSRETDDELLECVAKECMDNDVAVVVAKYLKEELKLPPAR